jgi:hypothetical protein
LLDETDRRIELRPFLDHTVNATAGADNLDGISRAQVPELNAAWPRPARTCRAARERHGAYEKYEALVPTSEVMQVM